MKTADTPEYITEVEQAVDAALEEAGYGNHPGYSQVKRWMRACPDQDWTSATARQDSTNDVVKKALSWAKREKLPRKDRPEPTTPKDLSWTGVGLALATVGKTRPLVETVRAEFWGTPEHPFETSQEGQEAALAWVQGAQKEDEATLGGKRPGWVTLSITLEAADAGTTRAALRAPEGELHTRPSVAEALAQVEGDIATNADGDRGLTCGGMFRKLELTDAEGWPYVPSISRGTRLARLAERVDEVCKLSGWWSETEALALIMCGFIPPAAVQTTVTHKGDGRREITMKVVAPTTVGDIAKIYQRTLDRHDLNPKPLSNTHHAVLELFYDTPGLSWPERYSQWLELCDKRPSLTRYSSPDSLAKTYKDALRRASWAEGKTRKVTP